LREQQCLDPVLDPQLLLHEALALAVLSLAVPWFNKWRSTQVERDLDSIGRPA